jgi:hypothetical protein
LVSTVTLISVIDGVDVKTGVEVAVSVGVRVGVNVKIAVGSNVGDDVSLGAFCVNAATVCAMAVLRSTGVAVSGAVAMAGTAHAILAISNTAIGK